MIITISGKPGSGKSTVARILAKKLKLKHYSAGDFMRQIAKERGVSLIKLSRLAEKNKNIDKEIDKRNALLAKKDNFVMDSRIGFYFIPRAVKIFLDVDVDEGARRIFKTKRTEEHYKDFDELEKELRKRMDSEQKRYKNYYGINIYDLSQFDLVIDTTEIPAKHVAAQITEFVKRFKN